MLSVARVLFYDVILHLVYIAADGYLIYFYLSNGDTWWGAATIAAVCLPGLLEFLVYTYSYLRGELQGTKWQQLREYLLWSLFSLLYPLSVVAWHIVQICKGQNNLQRYETIARSRVLNSLSVLTKSAAQMVLQTTIMMITWYQNSIGYRIYLPISAALSVIMLANSCTSHHYFESSGKSITMTVPYSQRTRRLFFTTLHIVTRGFVLALLASYLHYYVLVLFATMILANFVTAVCVVKTKWSKHLMTAFAAVLLPTCFVSREDVSGREHTPGAGRRLFYRFYRFNSLIFLVCSLAGLVSANCLLHYTTALTYTCDNLPFLSHDPSCSTDSVLAGLTPPTLGDLLAPLHAWFHVLGSSLVLGLGLLHVFLVLVEEKCCIRDYSPVHPM